MDSKATKQCGLCQGFFPATSEFFHRASKASDGLQSRCKSCAREVMQKWRQENPERNRQYFKTLHEQRGVERNAATLAHRHAHPEKLKAARRNDYVKHPERFVKHRKLRRQREAQAEGSFSRQDLLLIKAAQNDLCYWCKNPLDTTFHADHIIPIAKGGSNLISNICCSCPTCNWKKGDRLPSEFLKTLL